MAIRAPTPALQTLFNRIYVQLKSIPNEKFSFGTMCLILTCRRTARGLCRYIMEQVVDAFDAGEVTQADLDVLQMGWQMILFIRLRPVCRRAANPATACTRDDVFAPAAEGIWLAPKRLRRRSQKLTWERKSLGLVKTSLMNLIHSLMILLRKDTRT